jgi:tetratricopeptide (TPR) repeat protein/TolB-like protein
MRAEPMFNRLISSVADGDGVDWQAIDDSTHAENDRQAVADLRLVADIARVHRLLSEETHGLDGLEEAERSWGDLEIVGRLGEGAFGEVFLARDPRLDRLVALKLLRPEIASRPGVGEQLLTEARTLARLHHPNVVTIHGAATYAGRSGFWMEYIEGETLEDRLEAQGPFGAAEAAAVGRELCRTLAAVHKSGLIHRDIKARNVVRERGGRLVLMDFGAGISAIRALDPFQGRVGTPIYLAPETLAGASATVQSDLYAVGVLLYHLVTGHYPYQAGEADELRQAQATHRHIPLHDLRPDLPSSFIDVVERALAPAAERYRTAGEMADALRVDVDNLLGRTVGRLWRRRVFATIAVGVLALTLWWWGGRGPVAAGSQAVAVLPFRNLTTDPAMRSIAVGIARSVQRQLKHDGVTVRGGTEPGGAAGVSQAAALAAEMRADAVLDATFESVAGERFVLSVRLLDGKGAAAIWDRTYDLGKSEVPGIGRHVAQDVAFALGHPPGVQRNAVEGPGFPAFEAYSRGRAQAQLRAPEALARSIEAYKEAIRLSPHYADAWAGLADSYIALSVPVFSGIAPEEPRRLARRAALEALRLDPQLAEAMTSLAFIEYFHEWRWKEADEHFRRSIELDPQYDTAHWWYADYLNAMGRQSEALSEIGWARTLDPSSVLYRRDVAWHSFFQRRYADAVEELQDTLNASPDYLPAKTLLARALVENGNAEAGLTQLRSVAPRLPRSTALAFIAYAEAAAGDVSAAEQHLREAQVPAAGEYLPPYYVALVYARLGRPQEAVASLQRGFETRDSTMVNVNTDPRFEGIRARPDFQRIVSQMKFPGSGPTP